MRRGIVGRWRLPTKLFVSAAIFLGRATVSATYMTTVSSFAAEVLSWSSCLQLLRDDGPRGGMS